MRSPKGRKAWALLAYLVLRDTPPTRRTVAELLFNDAADPLATLRWTLSEIRRSTGWSVEVLGGDPLTLALPEGHSIDLYQLVQWPDQRLDLSSSGTLLGDLTFSALPAFEFWLESQRLQLAGREQTLLRDESLANLASGRHESALSIARRLVELDPLECRNQEALLRALAAAGLVDELRRHLIRCEDLFARELDCALPDTLIQAAVPPTSSSRRSQPVSANAEMRAQLEVGRAAITAGAIERGLEQLRRAAELASESTDPDAEAEALIELGEALTHAAKDRTTEVTSVLHRGMTAAHRGNRHDLASRACSELSYVHVQTGDSIQALYWIEQAQGLADGSDHLLALANGLRGLALHDDARYEQSLAAFGLSVEQATRAERPRQVAWSYSMAARSHMTRGDLASALDLCDQSIEIAQSERWAALLPWPQAQRGEILRRQQKLEEARNQLETAYALSREVNDHCWESVACRSLAAVARDRGQNEAAVVWTTRSLKYQLPYVWIHAHALEGKCDIIGVSNTELHRSTAQELATCAARSGLREFSARAALRLGVLGDDRAGDAAQSLCREIDNPALQKAVDSGTPL